MIKYSFVIPVYQTKNYLSECIDSILFQTYSNFEILLIDDGSTDGSSELCEEYKKKDSRVKVFHKQNEGQGIARNIGVEKAEGEYIIFIDSDDWWDDNNALEKIDRLSNDCDIIFFELKIMGNITKKIDIIDRLNESYSDGKSFMDDLLMKDPSFSWYPVIYAFKKNIWDSNNICFPQRTFYEDTATMFKLLLFAGRVKVLKEAFYCYRQSYSLSTTKHININLLINHIDVCNSCIEYVLNNQDIDDSLKTKLLNNFGCGYIDTMNKISKLERNEYKTMKEIMLKNIYMIDYVVYGKQKFMSKIINIFGIDISAILFGVFQLLKS